MHNNLQRDLYFINLLTTRLDLTKVRKELWVARCPLCGDSKKKKYKKRFYFYVKDFHVKWKCHNCGKGGNLYSFLLEKYPDLVDEYKFHGFKNEIKVTDKMIEKFKETAKIHWQTSFTINFLDDNTTKIIDLTPDHPARLYVKKRYIPFPLVRYCSDLYEFVDQLNIENKKQYKNYNIPCLMIPFFRNDDNIIEIVQARFFDKRITPKYLTIKLNPDALKLYNQFNVDYNSVVYVLEGPIDSMAVKNAVAMAGSDIKLPRGNYVWVYDNEVSNLIIVDKIEQKIIQGEKVIVWDKSDAFKDINEAIQKEIIAPGDVMDFLKSRTFSGLTARLKLAEYKK